MIIAALLLVSLISAYIACARPSWFWAIYLAGPSLLTILLGLAPGYNPSAILLGPLLLRSTDPGAFGMVVGVLYFGRHRGIRLLRQRPGGFILGSILVFFLLKVIWTVLLGSGRISANPTVSHAAGGLVAALGDLRDNLFTLVLPLYAYVVRKSCNLARLGRPLMVASALIVLRGLLTMVIAKQVWSDTADFRFIDAQEAISLTLIAILLLYLPVSGISSSARRTYVVFILFFGLLANHRSQWAATMAGAGIIALITLFGRTAPAEAKRNRVIVSGAVLAVAVLLAAISSLDTLVRQYPLLSTVSIRLYAITNPSQDADSKWRESLWQDRIAQVGGDWPWGRLIGDRHATLLHGKWLDVPDHSAYVSVYELGGIILCVLVALFWGNVIRIAIRRLFMYRDLRAVQTGTMTLSVTAASLAFGAAYDFPAIGPAIAIVLTLGLM